MSDTNFWSEPREPGLSPYGNNIGLDYGGTEQRLAWALDDSLLAQSVITNNGSQTLFPYSELSQGGSTGILSTAYSSSIRVVILTTSDSRVEVKLDGSTDSTNWFSLTGGNLVFIKQGSYTFCINPLKCPRVRLDVVLASSAVGVQIIC